MSKTNTKSSLDELSKVDASSRDLSSAILTKTDAIAQGNMSEVPGIPCGLASC